MALTPNEIAKLAYNAGFRGTEVKWATAVALAESSGNPNAYNPELAVGTKKGMGSYGLWQIYLTAHPEFRGQNLYNPQVNAKAAFAVYTEAKRQFTPWSTYNNGAAGAIFRTLKIDLGGGGGGKNGKDGGGNGGGGGDGGTPPPTTGGGGGGGGGDGTGGGLVNVNVSLLPQKITDYLNSPYAGFNIGLVIVGTILVVAGIAMLLGSFKPQQVVQAAPAQ